MYQTIPVVVRRRPGRETGMALVTVILVTMLCAALMVGFTSAIVADLRSNGLDRDQTQAYAAAHAGLEKLTSDLTAMFRTDFSPNASQISALTTTAKQPVIPYIPGQSPGFQYVSPDGSSGYAITFTPDDTPGNVGNPKPEPNTDTISAGPYEGLKGLITKYTLTVTARSNGGAEVRLRRELQTVAIPVFQFGMFSETDLAFHAGDDFTFGGRVHTNGNLYLAQATNYTLTLTDRITAVGEIVRTHLPNDLVTTSGYNGTIIVPTVIKTPTNTTRALARTEGSLTGASGVPSNGPTSAFWTGKNSGWDSISTGTYKSNIRNTKTGARRLDLPIVADLNGDGQPDAQPIELIRRPITGEPAFITEQRYFSLASFRILLSDEPQDIQNIPGVLQTSQPVLLDGSVDYLAGFAGAPAPAFKVPLGASSGTGASGSFPANTYRSDNGQTVIGGYIKIEMQRQDKTWEDVTKDILALGIAGRNLADVTNGTALASRINNPATTVCPEVNPNAVIRLQRVKDVPVNAATNTNTAQLLARACGFTTDAAGVRTGVSTAASDYWPNVLYDTREAQVRDGIDNANTDLILGGVMHYVELDMNNLRRYILGQIGTRGNQARNDNGFIVYFSDRRNNNNYNGNETGEYGYEDTTNPSTGAGTPNGGAGSAPETATGLDLGEDVNGNGTLQLYGRGVRQLLNVPLAPLLTPAAACNPLLPVRGVAPLNCAATVVTALTDANTGSSTLKKLVARANKAILFRRALKIVNGGIYTTAQAAGSANCNGMAPTVAVPCNNIIAPGLTIAAENPVYLQGDFNATAANASVEPNVATSIIADAVTVLSNSWNDIRSFLFPTDSTQRDASTTSYRVAIVTGKTRAFPQPTGTDQSFGSDGGAHNFVRMLEEWNGTPVLRYRGSFVSFFYSRQATGSFKCCDQDTYVRGERDWTFDLDFTNPALLPPGTPMFRDVNTLTFRQMLRPTEQ